MMKTRWPVTSSGPGTGWAGFTSSYRHPEVGGHLGYSGFVLNAIF